MSSVTLSESLPCPHVNGERTCTLQSPGEEAVHVRTWLTVGAVMKGL